MTSKFNLQIGSYLEKYNDLNEHSGHKHKDKPSYLGGALKGAAVGGLGGAGLGYLAGKAVRDVAPNVPGGNIPQSKASLATLPAGAAGHYGLQGALAGAGVGIAATALSRWLSKGDKH